MALVTSVLILLIITTIIVIPLSALLLWLTTKIFRLKDQRYKTAFLIILIILLVNLVFSLIRSLFQGYVLLNFISGIILWILISFLFAWWLIKTKYKLDWGKSFLVWLVWIIFNFILMTIASIILSIILIGMLSPSPSLS